MSLLVTGTIGIDTVESPYGKAEDVLGGSAAYFAFAAGLLTPVRLVGVVGEDFPQAFRDLFKGRPIDTAGLEVRAGSKTFRWHGRYLDDINERETVLTDLNVISEAAPTIPASFRDSSFVFLANTHPAIQRAFIAQLRSPKLLVCDTMNLWIEGFRNELLETLAAVHGVVLNDGEARMLTGENNLVLAGRAILNHGPEFVVIKKGEHGAMLVTPDEVFVLPAIPATNVKDPTGAGDSFAGGMMGYLAAIDRTDTAALKGAIARGTCVASITIEDFSLDALAAANQDLVAKRLEEFKAMLVFE
ncbi:MAG: sugar kinase [Phycisphaerae bacterium]|nr:sugar kinase [Phycisphaerae bacterium]